VVELHHPQGPLGLGPGCDLAVPGCQRQRRRLRDGRRSFGLTASGTGLAYQQAVTGWTRKAITFTDAGTGQFKSVSASLPDISTTSIFTVVFANVSTAAAQRNVITQGTTRTALNVNATPRALAISGANSAVGTVSPLGAVKPWGLRENHTAVSTTGFTDAEKLVPTHGTVTGKTTCIGSNSSNAPTMSVLYGWEWHGANAEISDANYKALLQALGFTIGWT
jgi:hypothetical protein